GLPLRGARGTAAAGELAGAATPSSSFPAGCSAAMARPERPPLCQVFRIRAAASRVFLGLAVPTLRRMHGAGRRKRERTDTVPAREGIGSSQPNRERLPWPEPSLPPSLRSPSLPPPRRSPPT